MRASVPNASRPASILRVRVALTVKPFVDVSDSRDEGESGFESTHQLVDEPVGTQPRLPDVGAEIEVSVVIPVLNEKDNVAAVYREVTEVLSAEIPSYELIFVDDGSSDDTLERLRAAAGDDPKMTVIELNRRFGQTAALAAGFRQARGRLIVPMDGDLQNDPRDIPRLVAKIDEPPGWDLVSGWRKDRKDSFLKRRLPSILANRLIGRFTRTRQVHDFGCTLKVYRRSVLEDVRLYGEMHRFLPAICKWGGARVTEEVVNHRPRIHGSSKYDLRRTAKVLLDLVTVKFLGDYLTKPLYFFGKAAIVTVGVSFLSVGMAVLQKFGYFVGEKPLPLNRNVLVLFGMMLFLMSIMFIMIGVLSELLVRIYHETQSGVSYKLRRVTRGGREIECRHYNQSRGLSPDYS